MTRTSRRTGRPPCRSWSCWRAWRRKSLGRPGAARGQGAELLDPYHRSVLELENTKSVFAVSPLAMALAKPHCPLCQERATSALTRLLPRLRPEHAEIVTGRH